MSQTMVKILRILKQCAKLNTSERIVSVLHLHTYNIDILSITVPVLCYWFKY